MADDAFAAEPPCSSKDWIVPMSVSAMNRLPLENRWEFTRRHPYYQRFWKKVADHCVAPSLDPKTREWGDAAKLLLTLIGVSGVPVNPSSPFSEMAPEGLGAFGSGAVKPAMMRTLIHILIQSLPAEVCIEVGMIMLHHGECLQHQPNYHPYLAADAVQHLRHPAMDSYPVAPIVAINVDAPKRAIQEAIDLIVQDHKSRNDLKETRRRDDKIDEYLAVWDAREGWFSDHYECGREITFRAMALNRKVSITTLHGQYRKAFDFLTLQRNHLLSDTPVRLNWRV